MKNFIFTLGLALASLSALAQGYPNQPIKWLVPYAAGGGTDAMARALAESMQAGLGQPIVIDNRAGAGGNIGGGYLWCDTAG